MADDFIFRRSIEDEDIGFVERTFQLRRKGDKYAWFFTDDGEKYHDKEFDSAEDAQAYVSGKMGDTFVIRTKIEQEK